MKITIPEDCGNSPRMDIISQASVEWAAGNTELLQSRLTDEFRWVLVGSNGGEDNVIPQLPGDAESIEIHTTINHGKAAACEGFMRIGNTRVDFCHIFYFTGAAKSAKIAEVRTFLISR
ncbi:MAG: hypothetical protein ACTIJ6_10110 [Leucobacter sp.]